MMETEHFDVVFQELGPQGEPGKDGITPHIGENGNWFIGEEDTGKSSKGERGKDGKSITITSIDESFEDGGANTVTFSDGKSVIIRNGKKGDRGEKGDTGEGFSVYKTYSSVEEMENDASNVPEGSFVLITSDVEEEDNAKLYAKSEDGFTFLTDMSGAQGITGPQGPAGYSPIKGKDYFDGKDGTSITVSSVSESTADGGENIVTFSDGSTLAVKNGSKGSQGDKGDTGYTPVKGTDYWTETDKTAMVNDVLSALPTWSGGAY